MNERMKELLKEATNVRYSGMGEIEDIDVEKFANLIIDECIACGSWVGAVNTNLKEPVATAWTIRRRINKRFGREEKVHGLY